jgi:dimethylargininase
MAQYEALEQIERVILRRPGKNMVEGAIPGGVGVPDFERARLQHVALTEALKACGAPVTVLNPDAQFPAGSRIADMSLVTEKLALLSNLTQFDPRQGEQQAVATVLAGCRFLKFVSAPGLFDAGDVLRLGNHFYIALSNRTNEEGAAQAAFYLKEFGHEATILNLDGGVADTLRFASSAVYLGEGRVLIREEIALNYAFLEHEKTVIGREHKAVAASVMVNGTLIIPQGFPEMRADLRLMEVPLIEVNISEFEKVGGTLAALALRLPEVRGAASTQNLGWIKQVQVA